MYKKYFKRIFDLIISFTGFPFLLLLYLPIAILIKLEDGGPVFYNALRIGKNGVPFKMYKFRTMKENSPDIRLPDGSTFNSKNDSRITRIGKFLRESSLDEIPQLINIILGEMSLIGPRPDINSNEKYPEETKLILKVKPGITGYSQAYFRNENNWVEKIKNDLYYVENLSFYFDIRILCKTISTILKRKNLYRVSDNYDNYVETIQKR